jgi:hypothetical protein
MLSRPLFLAFSGLVLFGCNRTVQLAPIASADLVQVTVDSRRLAISALPKGSPEMAVSKYCGGHPEWCSRKHVRDIRDTNAIAALIAFVNNRTSGWEEPWYGSPIPFIETILIKTEKIVGTFGAGEDFFSRGSPSFMNRAASAAEIQTFFD